MLGPRVEGDGMGRGKGVSIPANAITSRHTNDTETNQRPASHRADRTPKSETSNLYKQRKHGNRAQTELARRYGQGKCRKVQCMRTL